MKSVKHHQEAVAALVPSSRIAELAPIKATGLIVARDVPAPLSLPPFTNSAMDGYAVRAADAHAGAVLPVTADIPAGAGVGVLEPGAAHRIMTGAPIPDGTDSIVPVEHTDGGTAHVRIDQAAVPDRFLRHRGSDITSGETALPAGHRVGPATVGLASALGLTSIPVLAPPRIVVLSTGTELAAPGNPLRPGQIYESNAPMLAAALTHAGAQAEILRFVADDSETFLHRLAERLAAGGVDLVVTTGGVSAGAYEVVKESLHTRGVEFTKVAMQPGMPQGCGTVELPGAPSTPFVTFPGNPVSALVSFEVFLRAPLRASMGLPPDRPRRRMRLQDGLDSIAGKRQYLRGSIIRGADGSEYVRVLGGPSSHYLRWLAQADALVDIPAEIEKLAAGDAVDVIDLRALT